MKAYFIFNKTDYPEHSIVLAELERKGYLVSGEEKITIGSDEFSANEVRNARELISEDYFTLFAQKTQMRSMGLRVMYLHEEADKQVYFMAEKVSDQAKFDSYPPYADFSRLVEEEKSKPFFFVGDINARHKKIKSCSKWVRGYGWEGDFSPSIVAEQIAPTAEKLGKVFVIIGSASRAKQVQHNALSDAIMQLKSSDDWYCDKKFVGIHVFSTFSADISGTGSVGKLFKINVPFGGIMPGDNFILNDGDKQYGEMSDDRCHIAINSDIIESSSTKPELFSKIAEHISTVIDISEDEFRKQVSEIRAKKMISFFKSMGKIKVKKLKSQVDDQEKICKKVQEDLLNKVRAVQQMKIELEVHSKYDVSIEMVAKKALEGIGKMKKITSVSSDGKNLIFETNKLYCRDPRTKKLHEIGRMRVMVDFNSSFIKFFNLERKIRGFKEAMHAPHVFPDGQPCLGSMSSYLPQLVATYNLSAIASMAISFIEQVNVDDSAGKHVNKWPEVNEETLEVVFDLNDPRFSKDIKNWHKCGYDCRGCSYAKACPINNGAVEVSRDEDEDEDEDDRPICPTCDERIDDDEWCSDCEHCRDHCTCENEDED